jgi:phosphate uptake regulator
MTTDEKQRETLETLSGHPFEYETHQERIRRICDEADRLEWELMRRVATGTMPTPPPLPHMTGTLTPTVLQRRW